MKRGVQDVILLGFLAFSTIIIAFVLYSIFTQINAPFSTALNNANTTSILTNSNNMFSGFLNGIPLGLIIAGLFAVALAYFAPIHPVFLPLGIFLLLMAVVFFTFLNDAGKSILGTDFFLSFSSQFPLASAVFTNLPLIVAVFGALILIVTYKRSSPAGGPEG